MLTNRFVRTTAVGAALLFAVSCATSQAIRAGDAAARRSDWDTAVAQYRAALARDPKRIDAQVALRQATQMATQAHMKRAEALEAQDQLPGAEAEYRLAADLDPTNTFALTKAADIERTIRARIDASRPRPSIDVLKEQAQQLAGIPKLDPRTRVPSMRLSGSIRDILTTIGDAVGIDITFDRDANTAVGVAGAYTLTDSSIDEALSQILTTNQLTYKVITPKRILVFQDNQVKHQQYDDQYIQVFPLSHSKAQDVNAIVNQIFSTGGSPTVRPITLVNQTANSIIIKATKPVMDVLEALIKANDKPRAEVLIDVEILEVDRSRVRSLGLDLNNYALGFQLSPELAPGNAPGTFPPATPPPFNLNTISHGVSTTDFYMTVPSAKIKLLESDSRTKLLARPQLRGREGSPLSLTLGDDIPVPQTTVPVLTTGGNFTQPSTSYQYRKVGVNLTIQPQVTYQDEIILDPLTVERSALGPDVVIAGQSLPTFTDRSATVSLRLRDGESNLLAGLVREEDRHVLTSLPGILHLPFLRAIFGSSDHNMDQSDIVMIVTPHIVRSHELTPADLKPIYVGTSTNIGATGPPPLISLEAPPPPQTVTGGQVTGAPPATPPSAGVPTTPVPATGVMTPPATPPTLPTTNPRAPGVVPIEPVNPAAPPPAGPPAQIAAAAPAGDIRAGGTQTYAVPITISGVSQLGGVTLTISYNPAVLKATDVIQGTFMQQGRAETVFTPKIDAANGRVDVAITRPAAAGGATGEGMLVSITFQAVTAGNSPVSVTAVATGADGKVIQVQTVPAMVVVK